MNASERGSPDGRGKRDAHEFYGVNIQAGLGVDDMPISPQGKARNSGSQIYPSNRVDATDKANHGNGDGCIFFLVKGQCWGLQLHPYIGQQDIERPSQEPQSPSQKIIFIPRFVKIEVQFRLNSRPF